MSLIEIEKRILAEAQVEARKIHEESEHSMKILDAAHYRKIEELRAQILKDAKRRAEEMKTSILVPARLKHKKAVLLEKQKIMNELYRGRPEQVREETEIRAARILFGEQ